MFSLAILLAVGVLPPPLPISSAVIDATVEVCFAPEDDCAGFAERAIAGAEREILVSAYRLTVGSGVVGALIRAKERGVDVRVIADRGAPCGHASGIEPLAAAGVPVWIDDRARLAHAKTMVIDGAVTLQGSYNWTHAAAENSEDLNLISSPTLAAAYSAHWRQRLAVSVPFARGLVPASGGGGPVIGERSPTAQSLHARGLRRVTLLVPESCAEGLQDLARGLRAQQGRRTAVAPLGWRRLSPSAELMADPRLGARCAIRDTRVAGAERYYWTVTVIGEPDPVAAGRTADIAAARAQAEAALGASADQRERLGREEDTNA